MKSKPIYSNKIGRIQVRSFLQSGKNGSFLSHRFYRSVKQKSPGKDPSWEQYTSFSTEDLTSLKNAIISLEASLPSLSPTTSVQNLTKR